MPRLSRRLPRPRPRPPPPPLHREGQADERQGFGSGGRLAQTAAGSSSWRRRGGGASPAPSNAPIVRVPRPQGADPRAADATKGGLGPAPASSRHCAAVSRCLAPHGPLGQAVQVRVQRWRSAKRAWLCEVCGLHSNSSSGCRRLMRQAGAGLGAGSVVECVDEVWMAAAGLVRWAPSGGASLAAPVSSGPNSQQSAALLEQLAPDVEQAAG